MDMQVGVGGSEVGSTANSGPTGRAKGWANLKPMQPGQTLNPRGRPKKDYDLAQKAQAHAQECIDTLVEVMKDTSATPSARVSAASEILDRGFGKAPQSLDVEHKVTLSDAFEEFIRKLNGQQHEAPMIEATAVEAAE
jgi:hypothetical protein